MLEVYYVLLQLNSAASRKVYIILRYVALNRPAGTIYLANQR